MAGIRILDMTVKGRYAVGNPIYAFHSSFPTKNVRKVGQVVSTPEVAYAQGKEIVRAYEAADPYGNMGEVLGVTHSEGGYQAVINTFHSNT